MSDLLQRRWVEWAFVILLFASALFVRLYRLEEFPPGIFWDEAANGVDALNVLDGHHAIFFPRNFGREPIFIYMQAFVISLLGPTPYALRMTAAVVGAAAVIALYWMVREAFTVRSSPGRPGAKVLAAWTAAFMAFSYWHISISRIGFRVGTMLLVMAIASAFFWRSWRRIHEDQRLSWPDLLLCGFFVGLSLYTYIAARIVPLVFLVVPLVALAQKSTNALARRQIVIASIVVAVVAAATFLPLGYHFVSNGDAWVRPGEVSIFNPKNAASPLVALVDSTTKVARALLALEGDPNPRHNPANRPPLDWLTAVWLVAGLCIAAMRWREAPYLSILAMFTIMALPAVLTGYGNPHALRFAGMIPPTFVLAVSAMVATAWWLARRFHPLFIWLPLPFLLLASSQNVSAYFEAFRDIDSFKGYFISGCTESVPDFADYDPDERRDVWIVPLSANYNVTNAHRFMIDYLYQGISRGSVLVSEASASKQLEEVTLGKQTAYLVRGESLEKFPEGPYIFGDSKNLIGFLLQKYAQRIATTPHKDDCMSSEIYTLPPSSDYRLAGEITPRADSFADKLTLVGADFGRTAVELGETSDALESRKVPSGHSLWLYLRWRADAPIDINLKTRIVLKDQEGHIVGTTDDLLVSDRYPVFPTWEPGELASSYHVLDILPATAPGIYNLELQVYDEESLQPYPVTGADGGHSGNQVRIGEVEITLPLEPPFVTPQKTMHSNPARVSPVTLIGFDLPTDLAAPGTSLPLALYWQLLQHTTVAPNIRPNIRIALVDENSHAVAERTHIPLDSSFPIADWPPDTLIRDWHDLPIPATAPTGDYKLIMDMDWGDDSPDRRFTLANIRVEGRPHHFDPPPLAQPTTALFAHTVELMGIQERRPDLVATNGTLAFSLVWKALSPADQDLVRFIHILGSDGRPIAQQDTVPCAGQCPSTSWLQDEYLTDPVQIQLPPETVPGRYSVAVGWYEQNTLRRLPMTIEGASQATDLYVLPFEIEVPAP